MLLQLKVCTFFAETVELLGRPLMKEISEGIHKRDTRRQYGLKIGEGEKVLWLGKF